jgi:hypothetical protein
VAACECYYQLRKDQQFKALVERCVAKITDLQELEEAYGQPVDDGEVDAINTALDLIRPQQFRAVVWTTTKPSPKRRAALKGVNDNRYDIDSVYLLLRVCVLMIQSLFLIPYYTGLQVASGARYSRDARNHYTERGFSPLGRLASIPTTAHNEPLPTPAR